MRFRERLRQSGQGDIPLRRGGTVSLPKERAAPFLKEFDAPLAGGLIALASAGNGFAVVDRNESILIHGLESVGKRSGRASSRNSRI